MGKSRKSRCSGGQRHKHQPTGLPSVEDTLKAEEESATPLDPRLGRSGIPASINTCVDQLQSHESLEKECGLLTLAELCGQPEATPIFREMRLTRYVAPLVLDPEESVRVAAVGTLVAMAMSGEDEEAIDRMVQDDVMTPVVALFKKFFPIGWTADSSSKTLDVFVNAVSLLRSLCETSPTALQIFNREDVIGSLLGAINVKTYNHTVVVAVCESLLTVTESNAPAILSIKQNEEASRNLHHLVQLKPESDAGVDSTDSKELLLSILAAGILLNLSGEDLSSVSPSFLASIMTLIPAILKIDADHFISELKRLAPKGKAATASGGADVPMDEEMNGNGHPECDQAEERKEEEEEEEEPVDDGSSNILPKCHRSKTLERLCDLLTAQQMALEILTNICSAADDEWEDDDEDEKSSTSSDGQLDTCGSHEDLASVENVENLTLPSEVRDALMSAETISTIVRCCGSTFSQSRMSLEDYLDLAQARLIARKLRLVQTRALTALNNLVSSDATSLGGMEDLVGLFAELSTTLSIIADSDADLLEATTSAVRAVVAKISALDKAVMTRPRAFSPSLRDVDTLVDIYKSKSGGKADDRGVKVNVIRIASALAASAHVKQDSPETFVSIGSFLLSAALDADIAVAAEALDAIFDVFGDDDDAGENMKRVEAEIRLVSRLKDVVAPFQEKVRTQRKGLGPDQKAVVQTVRSNLLRFIKYKSQSK